MEIRSKAERDVYEKVHEGLLKAVAEGQKAITETREAISCIIRQAVEIEDAIRLYDGMKEEERDARRALDQGSRE